MVVIIIIVIIIIVIITIIITLVIIAVRFSPKNVEYKNVSERNFLKFILFSYTV